MALERFLIVNADDFGQSPGINRGVLEAHERGIVTSASLMVRWPAATEAAEYARAHPGLSIGLHLDLGEWFYDGAGWRPRYEAVTPDDAAAVGAEVKRQLDQFRALMGREPSHLDSHQHVHRREPARSALLAPARELGVPIRHFTTGIRYCGAFYGQTDDGAPLPGAVSAEALIEILFGLPPGMTELVCHPGYVEGLDSTYAAEREVEVSTLCDPRVRLVMDESGIQLCSHHQSARVLMEVE